MTTTVEGQRLYFNQEAIDNAASEILGITELSVIQKEEVTFMGDLAVRDIFTRVVQRGYSRGERIADASIRGFLLGHRVIREAAGESPLAPRPVEAAQNYYSLVMADGGRLDNDFERDFAEYTAIAGLVVGLKDRYTAAHTKLALNLYGKEANPDRPLELISAPRPKRPSHRQFIGAASASVRARR